jgi:hypothetical protein
MPTNKDLKKLVRDRMSKTGESDAIARMHLLAAAKSNTNGTGARGLIGFTLKAEPTPAVVIPEPRLFQLKISLAEIEPEIWRRLHVPATITLAGLHDVIQTAFAWWDYHLHQYIIDGRHYGTPDAEFEEELPPTIDERIVMLRDLVDAKEIVYQYDFGDSWEHRIEMESVAVAADPAVAYPVCVGGARSAPHEDCGGVGGYNELVAALRDKKHPEHRALRGWAGRSYDPEKFDLAAANRAIAKLARRRSRPRREGGEASA